jgi:hypothetical protein
MRIIGYTYDADIHCPACTHEVFLGLEDHGAIDSEDNEVQPILDTAEDVYLDHCGDCQEPLLDHDCDDHGRWEAGYGGGDLADADSARFQEHGNAKRWLIRELEDRADIVDSWADPPDHDCEAMGHEDDLSCPRQIANELSFLAADVSLISRDEAFETNLAGIEYWIKEVEA